MCSWLFTVARAIKRAVLGPLLLPPFPDRPTECLQVAGRKRTRGASLPRGWSF